MSCSMSVGRIIPASLDEGAVETATGTGFGVVVFVSCWFWVNCDWCRADDELEFEDDGEDLPPPAF